jgi:hypothetical protein
MITYRTPTEKTEKEKEEEEEEEEAVVVVVVVVVGHETGHEHTYIQYMRRDTSIHTVSQSVHETGHEYIPSVSTCERTKPAQAGCWSRSSTHCPPAVS